MDLHSLTTESINPETINIDNATTSEMLLVMNNENKRVTDAIERVLPEIEKAVEVVFQSIKNGRHVFLVGAGTSGRLGVLEAAECPPTFGVKPDLFQAIIAGGERAIFKSVESAEDNEELGELDLKDRGFSGGDVVIGIAASGRTPYVVGALKYARKQGAKSIAVTCNEGSVIGGLTDIKIEVVPGPEVVSGSTRLKAGTAQKMVLNMITTASMIKMGKVYQNLMVDLNVSNIKLKNRAINILKKVTGANESVAHRALEDARLNVKTAIVMIKKEVNYEEATKLLDKADGYVRRALEISSNDKGEE